MNEQLDLSISGSSKMPGGTYKKVTISGAGQIAGDLRCQTLRCSGAAHLSGRVDCAGEVHVSGAVDIAQDLVCGQLHSSGSFVCGGTCVCSTLHSSGSTKIKGKLTGEQVSASGTLSAEQLHCQKFSASGALKVSGDVEAESVRTTGAVTIGGLLNAEEVNIYPSRHVHINAIGGGHIVFSDNCTFTLFRRQSRAVVDTIEADVIELEYVEARMVRGRYVRLGEGCKIGTVEYTGSLDNEGGSLIEHITKVGAQGELPAGQGQAESAEGEKG